jgi:hypothetical protein
MKSLAISVHMDLDQVCSTFCLPPATSVFSEYETAFIPHTEKPRFNESEGSKDFILYSRGFVIAGALYYKTNYRGT